MYVRAKDIWIIAKELSRSVVMYILVYLFLYLVKTLVYAVVASPLLLGIYFIYPDHISLSLSVYILAVLVLFVVRGAWRGFDI